METIKNYNQPKAKDGEQKVILDPAITAETDELNPPSGEDHEADTSNQKDTIK